MPGGSAASITQIGLDQKQAEIQRRRAIEDANLEAIGAHALAKAKMQDILTAEMQSAADAETKAQIDETSGTEEEVGPTDALSELFQPINASKPEAGVTEMNAGGLLALPRGSMGGGPQLVQPNAGGGDGSDVGQVDIPEAPEYTTDQITETRPVETFPGIYGPLTSQRTEVRQNAITPAQVAQLRLSAAIQQEKQRTDQLKLWADVEPGTFEVLHGAIAARNPKVADELLFYRESNERTRRNKGTVTVFDPTSPTGGVTIPRSELPAEGYYAVPRKVQPDTIDLGKTPTKTVVSQIQESLVSDNIRLDRLNSIKDSFRPEFLQTVPLVQMDGAAKLERTLGISPEQADAMVQLKPGTRSAFRDFQSKSLTDLTLTIRDITGAAMTIPEAERITAMTPNLNDAPSDFIAKWNSTVDLLTLAIARKHYLLANGFGDQLIKDAVDGSESPDQAFSKVPLSMVTTAMGNRADFHYNKLSEEHPDWASPRLEHEAELRMLRDFGLAK